MLVSDIFRHLRRWLNAGIAHVRMKWNLISADIPWRAINAQVASVPRPSYSVTERPIFALVIGIDNYQDGVPTTLHGCVNDSENVFAYLKDTLHVPETNIVLLQNERATRKNILDAFESHFIKNSAITEGDAIIFYFAGHGSRQKAPVDWHSEENQVETICPYDVAKALGIPDYTFTKLMQQLAFYKGNNITLIFDSCHSGGMSRAGMETVEDAPLTRRYDPPTDFPALPAELDRRIWSWSPDDGQSEYLKQPELPGSFYKAMETHVLLAACQPGQTAKEVQNGGVSSGAFTTALIAALKAWDPSTSPLTYSRLMEHLSPLDDQHPHCEGRNKVRRLFSASDHGRDDPSYFIVTAAATSNDAYYVAAGNLLGIVEGTEFITHPPEGSTRLTLVAKEVEDFRCLVVPRRDSDSQSQLPSASILPQHSRATIRKWRTKWLQVELDPPDAFPHITEDSDALFSIVESGGELKASRADCASTTVQLVRNDPLLCSQPEWHLISVNFDTFTRDYLNNVARFHFFLYQQPNATQFYRSLSNPDPTTPIPVTASLQRLTEGPQFIPVGDNLFHADVTRKALAGTATLQGSACNIRYGLTLENHTSTDFFPYVFIFDPQKSVIEPVYMPHSDDISPPLTRRGTEGSTLGIGYGAQGTDNMSFPLPEGLDQESAFFKVFVSTVYMNMEAIMKKPGERHILKWVKPIEQCWDSWIYLVTVRR